MNKALHSELRDIVKQFAIRRQSSKNLSRQDIANYGIYPLFRAMRWGDDSMNIISQESFLHPSTIIEFNLENEPIFLVSVGNAQDLHIKEESLNQRLRTLSSYAYNRKIDWVISTSMERTWTFNSRWQTMEGTFNSLDISLDDDFIRDTSILRLFSRPNVIKGGLETLSAREKPSNEIPFIDSLLFEQLIFFRNAILSTRDKRKLPSVEKADKEYYYLLTQLILMRIVEDNGLTDKSLSGLISKRQTKTRQSLETRLNRLRQHYKTIIDTTLLDRPIKGGFAEESISSLIKNLYQPSGYYLKYDFKNISTDVLGSIYEQYLSFIASEDTFHIPALEPDLFDDDKIALSLVSKRKSRSIYYTPSFICNFIADNTVKSWINENSNPTRPIKVLDMSCGSGSFLLSSLNILKEQLAESTNLSKRLIKRKLGDILSESIFGVDIDPKAVEIAKVNLIKDLIEKGITIPDLNHNIKVGNSLIDKHIDNGVLPLDEEDPKRPIIWKDQFKDIMNLGGFDVIIGNPPYQGIRKVKQHELSEYYKRNYVSAKGAYDLYFLFIERSIDLLREGGYIGMIIPRKFYRSPSGKYLRRAILKNSNLRIVRIVDFTDQQVFPSATNYTSIMILQKSINTNSNSITDVIRIKNLSIYPGLQLRIALVNKDPFEKSYSSYSVQNPSRLSPWLWQGDKERLLRDKIESICIPLSRVARISQGLKTGRDKVFILDVKEDHPNSAFITVQSKENQQIYELEREILKPLLRIKDMKAYLLDPHSKVVLFPYEGKNIIMEIDLKKRFPKVYQYLCTHKELLESRIDFKGRVSAWYGYSRRQALNYNRPKILTPYFATRPRFSFDTDGIYAITGGASGGNMIFGFPNTPMKVLMAILNSKLAHWYIKPEADLFKENYYSFEPMVLNHFPIPDFKQVNPSQINKINRFVDQILSYKDVTKDELFDNYDLTAKLKDTIDMLDIFVYKMYNLNPDEQQEIEDYY